MNTAHIKKVKESKMVYFTRGICSNTGIFDVLKLRHDNYNISPQTRYFELHHKMGNTSKIPVLEHIPLLK